MANWTDNGYGSAPEGLISRVLDSAHWGYWVALVWTLVLVAVVL